jgi:DNA polymerase-3 subunit epsilon
VTVAGVTTRQAETLLTVRAADLLAAGPATAAQLVKHVCQIPAVPGAVAEHMAAALFAGRPEFVREADGTWRLRGGGAPNVSFAPGSSAVGIGSRTGVAETRVGTYAPPGRIGEGLPHVYMAPVRRGHPLRSLSYTVVDVETTGTSPNRGDRITEIAAVRVENGEVRDVFETLINPERSIPPFVTALTSITWDMVKDAPRFRDICDELLARMEGTVFVAHNASFDWRFVSAEVTRATGRLLEGRKLCTVRLARAVLPQLRRRSLDWVANHYGIVIEGRHRAGGDALATARCLVRMLHNVADRGCDCWDDLETLLGTSQRRRPRRPRRPSAMPQPVTRDTTA